jgi:2-dehydro-3-deoxygalactonokinase
MPENPGRARHVLGDWGTTRLRLFLVENDVVTDRCEGPGIRAMTMHPVEHRLDMLADLVKPWIGESHSMRVLLAGMAGSRNGLFEVPYMSLPADGRAWSLVARTMSMRGIDITIAAGLCSREEDGADVMRGEETQVFGAMDLEPALKAGTHALLLPGTHSKWVRVIDGSITRFRTAMTGEIYALLLEHSTLLKTDADPASPGTATDADRTDGFRAGMERSVEPKNNLLASLFEARAAQLLRSRSKSWATGFLSGLLIGEDIRGVGTSFATNAAIRIIGDPELTSLYRSAFSARGVETQTMDGADCVIAGLSALQRHLADR